MRCDTPLFPAFEGERGRCFALSQRPSPYRLLMTTLVFPLQVERFDDMQGVYGRQIARLISERLNASNVPSTRLTWYAKKGDQRAHVTVEAPFPINVIKEEAQAHKAQTVVLGRVRVAPESTRLQLVLLTPEDPEGTTVEVFDETTAVHALPQMVERASNAVLQKLSSANSPAYTAAGEQLNEAHINPAHAFEAWRDALQQADAVELEHQTPAK